MEIVADLQLHSKYSRAVSKYMELPFMAEWARKKGIDLITTGDWQHPEWFQNVKENLIEVDEGVFKLKNEITKGVDEPIHTPKFLLVTEISSIYSQGGKGRRIHNLIFSPSISICEKFISELEKRGANLSSDGRPIVGLSSRELLEIALHVDENMLFLPAHVWTPWFGVFGSKSGFDSIEECFGDLNKYIYAIETGLSSDPIMNWGIKELENRSIVSFSDAHSGPKMGREATVFKYQTRNFNQTTGQQDRSFGYKDITGAINQDPDSKLQIAYTIEFFPEEGKYHLSGHRAHGVIYSEKDLQTKGHICPVCKRKLTLGVEHRICTLSEKVYQEEDLVYEKSESGVTFVYDKEKKKKPFVSIVPLLEILQETLSSKAKAEREYERVTSIVPEFELLLRKSYQEINDLGIEGLSEAVGVVRERGVHIEPGYDGVFGKVKIKGQTGNWRQ